MRKIESVIGYDGIARNLVDLEDEFYRAIVRRGNPFERLNDTFIQNLITGRDLTINEKKFLRIIRIYKRSIALANPNEMQSFIEKINLNADYSNLFFQNNIATRFSIAIQKALNYKGFRKAKTKGIWLAQKLNIKVCPYCNTQYTLVIKNGENHKAKFQFDHFFPKSRYPFFSLSLYNLIPSCASCNLSKKETNFNIHNHIHPYLDSLSDYFKYKFSNSTENKFIKSNGKLDLNDIEIEISTTSDKVNRHNQIFEFEHIHQRHKDIVQEILLKSRYYPETKISELLSIEDRNGVKLFSDKSEVLKLLLGNYALEEDINKRPLSKFMQDIARQAGLII